MKLNALLHWPRTLFARLALILFVGLALVQTLVGLAHHDRARPDHE